MGDEPGSLRSTKEANAAWGVLSLLLAGMLTWGGFGWLLDHWLGTKFLLPVGLIVGVATALYLVIRRYSSAEALAEYDDRPQSELTERRD